MQRLKTIYDIAKEAGVSSATVSRVVSGSGGVSAGKRDAVQQLIEKYQFKPSTVARGLTMSRTHTLGLMVADIRNPYYAALAVEIEKSANEIGLTVLLCNALNNRALEIANLERLYSQRVEAIIQIGCSVDDRVTDPAYAALVRRITQSIPFVTTGVLDGVSCGIAAIDYADAMRQVFDHLINLGHERIAMIGGRDDVRSTHEMYQHYLYYQGKHNLILQGDYILEGDYDQESGYRCMNALMQHTCPPTAVIAVNDYTAVGVLKAATEHGWKVPEDCSIVSFDNTFLAKITSPQLTSVDYSYADFGAKLLGAALSMSHSDGLTVHCLIEPQLVERESSASPKRKVNQISA